MSKRRIEQVKYAFRSGARYSVGADVVGAELARVQRENGVVTAPAVVDAARPDLMRYLELAPDAEDSEQIRELLVDASRMHTSLN